MTKTTSKILALVALALGGCGEDGLAAFGADAGDGTGGAGGVAGASSGTGGAPQAGGAIGSTFTRDDHAMCMEWPICPDDVISPATALGRVVSQECKAAFDGVRVICGACMRKSTCEQFVGRCVAPFVHNGVSSQMFYASALKPAACQAFLDGGPLTVQPQWVICTGDTGSKTAEGEGVNARTVCQD